MHNNANKFYAFCCFQVFGTVFGVFLFDKEKSLA